MAVDSVYENTATISTTEYSLTNNSTTVAEQTDEGAFQAFIEVTNMAAGDQYVIRVLEKVVSAGTQRELWRKYLTGDQGDTVFVTPALALKYGWDITMQRLTGADRSIIWSIRRPA